MNTSEPVAGPPLDPEDSSNQNQECKTMPCFNTDGCKPAWLCSPPKSSSKKYEIPAGVTITPISKTGRFRGNESVADEACSCGCSEPGDGQNNAKDSPAANQECPGFFSRITSMFCSQGDPEAVSAECPDTPSDKPNVTPAEVPCAESSECSECKSEEVECDCGCECEPVDPAKEFLSKKCDCSVCVEEEKASAPVVVLPNPDCRDAGVKAQEMLDSCCSCRKCVGAPPKDPPRLGANGEPLPVGQCGGVTCGECGYIRGQNVICCKMCEFSVRMKEEGEFLERRRQAWMDSGEDELEAYQRPVDPDAAPFKWSKGKPVFEGGMSLARANNYLWAVGSRQGEGYRKYAVEGQVLLNAEPEEECTCEDHLKKKRYRGGMTLEESQEYLWIKNKLPPPAITEQES